MAGSSGHGLWSHVGVVVEVWGGDGKHCYLYDLNSEYWFIEILFRLDSVNTISCRGV